MREHLTQSIMREKFEYKRKQLVTEAEKLGLSHPDVIKMSQELDLLHCEIQFGSYK